MAFRKTIILARSPGGEESTWGNLKKALSHYGLSHNANVIRKKVWPVHYRGFVFRKFIFNPDTGTKEFKTNVS